MTLTEKAMEEALRDLGGTSAEVAATLERLGIVGTPCAGSACPIVHYLAGLFPGHRFAADRHRVEIDGEGRFVLPYPVERFISDFDHSFYPRLIVWL